MKKNTLFIITLFTVLLLYGQNAYQPELGNQDYEGLIKKAQEALKRNRTDSLAHYYMGFSYTKLKQPKKGIEYLVKAKNNGLNVFPVQLNLAKNYVAINELDKALTVLKEGADSGSGAYQQLDVPEFDGLRANEKFTTIRQQMYNSAFPCKADKKFRKFDFWLGEWEVFAANGNGPKIAESTISLTNGDCGILENYRPTSFAGGHSISYYDVADKKWKQNWVAGGNVSHYIEPAESTGANMELVAPSITSQGKPSLLRMRYYKNDDGSVRQLMETSLDEGNSWSPVFDGLYKKK